LRLVTFVTSLQYLTTIGFYTDACHSLAAGMILPFTMMISTEEIQKHFPLFEPALVQEIIRVAEIKTFGKGEFILRSGQYIRSTLIILDGLVKVFRDYGSENGFFMHYLKSGDAFALTMIYGNRQEPSEVTAVAFKKTIVLAIPLSCMDKWMVEHKTWYQFVFDTFRQRVRILLDAVDTLAFLNTNERLIHYLINHKNILNTKNIPITRSDIAREMNSSREVITRLLKKLAAKGRIKMHRQNVEIIDLE